MESRNKSSRYIDSTRKDTTRERKTNREHLKIAQHLLWLFLANRLDLEREISRNRTFLLCRSLGTLRTEVEILRKKKRKHRAAG